MVPQNRCDGKHADSMIKDFREFHDTAQDTLHHMTLCNGMREYIKHTSCNMTYILNEQLCTMDHCICPRPKVQVEGLEGESMSHIS